MERETIYAIEYGKTRLVPWHVKWVKRIVFEWTSGYGLHYIRPLLILFGFIEVFSIIYIFPLIGKGRNGIYRIWSKDRVNKSKIKETEHERLIFRIWRKKQVWGKKQVKNIEETFSKLWATLSISVCCQVFILGGGS